MRLVVSVLSLAACGNDLPGLGTCDVPADSAPPTVDVVPLAGRSAGFDDLSYSARLGKVVAAPEGTAKIFLVDPETLDVAELPAPGGSASADASATTIYVADRSVARIVAIDAATGTQLASQGTAGGPDYVRAAITVPEVWVTLPGRDEIQILDATTLAPIGAVDVNSAPEGLTFDGDGRAYTQSGGKVVVIDVASRQVIARLDDGCGGSHGFPQADPAFDLVVGGCSNNGGAGVVTGGGDLISGREAGGGSAILAYAETLHHLYLRGDPGSTLDILGVCSSGEMSLLASVPISDRGHGATADDHGHAWVADAITGGIQRITDPFAPTE